jgi:hypothetical protein
MTQLSKKGGGEMEEMGDESGPNYQILSRYSPCIWIQGVGVVFYLVWGATAASARVAAAPAE